MGWKRIQQLKELNLNLGELKLKCRVGLHNWSEWTYLEDNTCQQERHCQHASCDAHEEQVGHLWSEWEYQNEESCDQTHSCVRCGQTESRTEHTHELTYESPNSCKQVMACTRCSEKKEGFMASLASTVSTKHEWSKWEYESATSCVQHRFCDRCGEEETKTTSHAWSEWLRVMPNECRYVRVCQRCQARDNEIIEHDFGEWQRYQPKSCVHIRGCNRCRAQENTSIHEWRRVQHNVNVEEIIMRQFFSLIIQNGGKREEIAVVEHQYNAHAEEFSLFGNDENSRKYRSEIIFRLEQLAGKYSVSVSLNDFDFDKVFDDQGRPYIYDKRGEIVADAYCCQCGALGIPNVGDT